MTTWGEHVEQYLQIRRSLGAKLVEAERDLREFAAAMQTQGQDFITVTDAINWAVTLLPGCERLALTRASRRIGSVRGFALYLAAIDPRNQIPPAGCLSVKHTRPTPRIFSLADIQALIQAARQLRYRDRDVTYPVLFGLLACTGIRIGEALRLHRAQTDLDEGILTINDSKSGTSRLIPLHPSTLEVLREYDQWRGRFDTRANDPLFFTGPNQAPIPYSNVYHVFNQTCHAAGLDRIEPRCHIHCMRHSFAVNTLINWVQNGQDVQAIMPVLSTWLGHVEPKDTYWYLTAVPELMGLAVKLLATTETWLP